MSYSDLAEVRAALLDRDSVFDAADDFVRLALQDHELESIAVGIMRDHNLDPSRVLRGGLHRDGYEALCFDANGNHIYHGGGIVTEFCAYDEQQRGVYRDVLLMLVDELFGEK